MAGEPGEVVESTTDMFEGGNDLVAWNGVIYVAAIIAVTGS